MTNEISSLAPTATAAARSEIAAVWLAVAGAAIAVLVTYARLPPSELYHTSEDGIDGGLGRTLVFLNFPVALVAVPVALIAAAVLRRRAAVAAALVVAAAAAFVPFAVDQDDLDAKPVNAIPALGVLIALLLTVAAVRRPHPRPTSRRLGGDRIRVVLAAVLLAIAVPWFFAELGFYAPDPILADEPSPDEPIAAVHLGHHHGTDGVLLAVAALLLSRVPPRLATGLLPAIASGYLALMLVYGVTNAVQDAWFEQAVKRGTTDHAIPTVLLPDLSLRWALLLAAAAVVELAWFRRERRAGQRSARPARPASSAEPS